MKYQTTRHYVGKRKADDTNFNLVIALLVACIVTACSIVALGDDPKDKPKAPPAEVTLAAATVKELQDNAKDARIAQLEYENLAREIQLAQARLEKLKETAQKAQDSSNAAFRAACVKAGIPASEVDQYEGTAQADGSLLLKRKAVTPAK